jgi:hypothetical protein
MTRKGAIRKARIVGLAIVLVMGLNLLPTVAHAFTRAITDDVWFTGGPSWVTKTSAAEAKIALIEVDWVSVEPNAPPAGVDPTNPAGPEYTMGYLDQRVKEFAGSGIQVAFLVGDAPQWAETPGGPADLEARGGWEPSPTALGQMATALAKRYSGSYPDPMNPGHTLPRVRYFQAWGEANFTVHLAPQWTKVHGAWVNTGPTIYRGLLNAFYAGVKSVHGDNFVLTTGFGPFGDLGPGNCTGNLAPQVGPGCRTPPAAFARALLCLQGRTALSPVSCPTPAHFDAMAIDPYQVGTPTTQPLNPDDVSVPTLNRITKPLNKAAATGRALPRGRKQLWVTEFSYDSRPGQATGVSPATQARWLDEAMYLFWKQGVSTAVWYLARDQATTCQPTITYCSGLYLFNGNPKPSLEAYRFPLVIWPPSGGPTQLWGIAPRSGKLVVQRQSGGSWKTIYTFHVSTGGVFSRNVPASLGGKFRGVVGGEISPVWSR